MSSLPATLTIIDKIKETLGGSLFCVGKSNKFFSLEIIVNLGKKFVFSGAF